MDDFLAGMITMGFLVAGLFFLRFWRRTADVLFAVFAAAFWLFALNQALLTLLKVPNVPGGAAAAFSWIFLPRIAAFGLLILAILAKNFDRTRNK
jgi:hypothetical protein